MDYKKIVYFALGALLLVAGLDKFFVKGSEAIIGMLSGIALFAWGATFWAWVLILGEIIFGAVILLGVFITMKKKYIKLSAIGGAIIIFLATLTVHVKWGSLGTTSWNNVISHVIIGFSYLMLGEGHFNKK